jgi:hypothetical protein
VPTFAAEGRRDDQVGENQVSDVQGSDDQGMTPSEKGTRIGSPSVDIGRMNEVTRPRYGCPFAIVPDRSSPAGFKKSNATVAGDMAQVILVNVTPGAVPQQVTPPAGMSCTVYRSARPQGSEAVVGYTPGVSTLSRICR